MIGMGTPNSHSRIPRPIISSLDRREPRHSRISDYEHILCI
jgi:hypothetical protein